MTFHTLGSVEELVPVSQTSFAYNEFATITTVLGDGESALNGVIQSSAPSFRQARLSWGGVDEVDMEAIEDLAESKEPTLFAEEDDAVRLVVVMDFGAELQSPGLYMVSATLVEMSPPTSGS